MQDSEFARGTCVVPDDEPNPGTRFSCPGGVFTRSPLAGAAAMARYELGLRRAAKRWARECVFVAMVDSDDSAVQEQVLAPGESVVFGRHEHVGLQHLSKDISLRHVAVAVAPSPALPSTGPASSGSLSEPAPLVRMWDLATGRPFHTEDGQPTEAITADGPVFATVGSVLIVVIPLASLPQTLPDGTEALWSSLPSRKVISRVASGSVVHALTEPPKPTFGQGTRVTRVKKLLPIESCDPAVAIATVQLSTDAGSLEFFLSAEALERGVLIGRYGRCLRIPGEVADVSRVHLLLSQVGAAIMAMDMGSTSGCYDRTGKCFDSMVLGQESTILLADSLRLRWLPRMLPIA